MALETVIVNSQLKLKPVSTSDGVTRYHEIYFGWETGLFHEFDASLSPNDVAETYRLRRQGEAAQA